MSLRTYDPKQVIFTWSGLVLTGFAAGTVITAARTTDLWEMIAGSDGEVTRIKSNDRSGTVAVTLQQGSASNELLMAKVLEDEIANTAIGALLVKDFTSPTAFLAGPQAFIKRMPDWARASADESNVEWMFAVPDLQIFHGRALSP